jgi:nitrite reductase/ring-hydroxylating ferredoxin subunit
MAAFVTVARTDELAPGQGKLVEVNQKRIALFNVGGRYYAVDDMCPHRGGPLSDAITRDGLTIASAHGPPATRHASGRATQGLPMQGNAQWI